MGTFRLLTAGFGLVIFVSCVAHHKDSSDNLPSTSATDTSVNAPGDSTATAKTTATTSTSTSGSTTDSVTSVEQDPRIAASVLPNFHQINTNVFRSGRPTKESMAALAKLGVKTVLSIESYGIDKDDAQDEQTWAQSANLKFLHIPMSGLLKPKVEQIHEALGYLQDPANYPILVHCEKGSDRTGIVVASYHIKNDGWDVKKATDDMYNYGHSKWLSWWDSILNDI